MFPYHLVSSSPWPLLMSLSALIFAIAFVHYVGSLYVGLYVGSLILFGLFSLAIILAAWFRDLLPSLLAGSHPRIVQLALIYGFILFLLSEIFLFFSFFWAYFYSALIPSIELGLWPPIGVESLDPWSIPLMGTLILLSSGATATLAHYGSLSGDKALVLFALLITILLGIGFIALQLNEYLLSGFSIADSLFGSAFYLLFLAAILTAISFDLFSTAHHLALEFALWYWHLVDAVWLIPFIGALLIVVFLSYYSLPSLPIVWALILPMVSLCPIDIGFYSYLYLNQLIVLLNPMALWLSSRFETHFFTN